MLNRAKNYANSVLDVLLKKAFAFVNIAYLVTHSIRSLDGNVAPLLSTTDFLHLKVFVQVEKHLKIIGNDKGKKTPCSKVI